MSVQIRNVILLVLLRAPGVAGQECEILSNPNAENVAELGLSWCPSDVSFQVRAFALQAARAQCALTTGRSSTPEQIQARKQGTRTACEILAGLDVSNCRCPPGLVTPLLRRPVVPPVPASRLPEDFHSKAAQLGAQSCQGQPKGASCWMELSNQPGCYVWNPYLQLDETVTWAGVRAEGWAQGKGTLKWVWDGGQETAEDTGRLQAGKRHGLWVQRTANGSVQEGPYVEGKAPGRVDLRNRTGRVVGSVVFQGSE